MNTRTAPFDLQEMVERFAGYDRSHNRGRGQADEPDSGSLGWGESGYLDAYVKLYESTGDEGWLGKVVDHFDRMIATGQDHFADGHATWVTPTYSVALVRTGPMHNRGMARITPQEDRVWVIRGGDMARDSIRIVEILPGRRYAVQEYGTRKVLAGGRFRPGLTLNGFAPFKISIEGTARVGDRFWVQVFAGEPLEYIVHQGMFLHPVSRFVEHVMKDVQLKAGFGTSARAYLRFIGEQIADKHERDWVDLSPSAGGYRFSPWMTERFPNRIMPHNQYLALARAYLSLQSVSRKRLFADRAHRMAKNFRRHLWKTGRAYTWHYWDWLEGGVQGNSGVEDTSHGRIDVGFAVDACRSGVVFNNADMKRFAHTLLDQMWNGSVDDPVIGGRVDSMDGDSTPCADWIDLCQWNPRVWDVMWAVFCKAAQPVEMIPSILQGWRRLGEGGKR